MTRTVLPVFVVLAVQASSTSCNNFNSFCAMARNDEANSRLGIQPPWFYSCLYLTVNNLISSNVPRYHIQAGAGQRADPKVGASALAFTAANSCAFAPGQTLS